ncbi:hypothetical protein J8J04_02735 ['Fragaria x ananassa' phyllody phytoplasma]|uniref:Uncharacterized protein n=1 Tax='Fragaria x ananassa' phyllody phytoplasma TaxID=2358428 RepID=A0ABS5K3T9_9MOLU|nr:hypothetical protein ['Fragaria x ananassa' phyllody phytoplasma]MBS2126589.1 hypothetical protein ['Fragaria x ananassa' phyllody phytoplasma]
MNELSFAIGFIIGSLFTTALLFIVKKIFFNINYYTQPPEMKKTFKELKKENNKSFLTNNKTPKNSNLIITKGKENNQIIKT